MNNRSIFTMLISGANDDGGGNVVDHRNRNHNRPSHGRCHIIIRGHHHHRHRHHHHKNSLSWIATLLLIVISTTKSCSNNSNGKNETTMLIVDAFQIIRNTRTKTTEIVPCNNTTTHCSLPSQSSFWLQQQRQHQLAMSPSSSNVFDTRLWTVTTTATTNASVSRQQQRRQRRKEQRSLQVQLPSLLATMRHHKDRSGSNESNSRSDSMTTTALDRISHTHKNDTATKENKEYRLSKFMSDSLILMYHFSKQLLP